MTELELMQSLLTQPVHVCPDGTMQYTLRPPHKATDGWVKLHPGYGRVKYDEKREWTLEEVFLVIQYCPWCGQRLPTEDVVQPDRTVAQYSI